MGHIFGHRNKLKSRFFPGLLLVMLTLSLGLTACAEQFTPTPAIAPGATATNVPSTTTAGSTPPVQTTSAPVPTLPTSTPLPAQTTAASTTAAPTSAATSAAVTPSSVFTAATPTVEPTGAARIAYIDNYNLVVIDPNTKAKQILTDGSNSAVVGTPAWSPDKKTLVFAALSNSQNLNARASVYALSASGNGTPVRLVSNQPENASDLDPLWSPDGTTILFTRRLASTGTQFDPNRSKHEVWLVDANGQNARKLASGKQPVWSPDGRRIAFVTDGTLKPGGLSIPVGNALHIINNKGQNEWEPINTAKIPNDFSKFDYPFGGAADVIQYPAFVDAGKTLAFTTIGATGLVLSVDSTTGGDLKLWNGQPEGGYKRTLAQPKSGSLLIFEGLPPSGIRSFAVVDVSKTPGGAKPPLQSFGSPSKGEALYPAWSPDGTQVAFISAKSPATDFNNPAISGSLVIAKIGSSEVVELAKGTISGIAWA